MGTTRSNRPVGRHSKTDVVDAALRLLDDRGLPALSMRAIADALGVQVSALYWHFPNKQTLLASVCERILEHGRDSNGGQDDVASVASNLRDSLLTYRDGAELVSSSLALGLIDLTARRSLIDAAGRAGLEQDRAPVAADTIVHYVIGYAFHEQQRRHGDSVGVVPEQHALSTDQAGARNDDFRAGLDFIIAGIHAAAIRRDSSLT